MERSDAALLEQLRFIWKRQCDVPVALRRTGRGERLRVKLPYGRDNARWLRHGRPARPEWIDAVGDRPGYWELPKAWFDDFVDRALLRYGKIYIVQPYRAQEICSPQCQNARGHDCQCSCMGEHHGVGGGDRWFEVSDVFMTRWGGREIACRLLTSRIQRLG